MRFMLMLAGGLFVHGVLQGQEEDSSARTLKTITVSTERAFIEQKIDRIIFYVSSLISNTGANGLDILNSAPGVSIEEGGEVSLHGKAGALVFIDDKPVFLSGKDLVSYLRSLPPGTIDRIELMTNPPARYRADGAAGIINIRTKKNKQQGINGSFTGSYSQGVYPKANGSLALAYRKNKTSWNGSLGYSLYNTFFKSDRQRHYLLSDLVLDQHNLEISSRSALTYRFGLEEQISPKWLLALNFNGSASPYHEDSRYQTLFHQADRLPDSVMNVHSLQDTRAHINTVAVNLVYLFPKSGAQLSMDLDCLDYRYDQDQTSMSQTALPDQTLVGRYDLYSSNPFKARIYSGRIDYENQLSKGRLEAGLQTSHSQRHTEGLYFQQPVQALNAYANSYHYQENITAAYVDYSCELKRWSAKAGLRLENTDAQGNLAKPLSNEDSSFHQSYTNLFPTFYLSYKLDTLNKNQLGFSAGKRMLRPAYQDLNPSIFFFDKYTYLTGNPLLRPEYAYNLELSFNHSNKWTLVAVYGQSRDAIVQVFQQIDSAFVTANANLRSFSRLGLNSSASFRLAKWWNLNTYVELNKTHYKGMLSSKAVLDANRTTIRITATNRFSFSESWSGELGGFYKNRVLLGQAVLEPGWQIYATVQKKLFESKASISLTVRDLARSWIVRRTIALPGLITSNTNRLDTRLINLAFTYKFGKINEPRRRKSAIEAEQGRL